MTYKKAEYIKVTKRDGKTPLFYLSPESDNIVTANINVTLGNESILTIKLPIDTEKINYIEYDSKFLVDDKEFIINTNENAIEISRDKDGKSYYQITAYESFVELNNIFCSIINYDEFVSPEATERNKRFRNGTYTDADVTAYTHIVRILPYSGEENDNDDDNDIRKNVRIPHTNPFEVGTIGHALYAILAYADWGNRNENERWYIDVDSIQTFYNDLLSYSLADENGYKITNYLATDKIVVDDFFVNYVANNEPLIYALEAEGEKCSVLSLLRQLEEIYGAIIVFNSKEHTIGIRNPKIWQPYRGYQLRYGKNIESITRTINNKIINKLYINGNGFSLDTSYVYINNLENIHGENLSTKYLNGVKFIKAEDWYYNDEEKEKYFLESTAVLTNSDIYLDTTNEESIAKSHQMLFCWGLEQMSIKCKPRYTYQCNAIDLRTLPDYAYEEFELGDMAMVIDPIVGTSTTLLRIVRHQYEVFKPQVGKLEIGYIKDELQYKLAHTIKTAQYLSNKFSSNGVLTNK